MVNFPAQLSACVQATAYNSDGEDGGDADRLQSNQQASSRSTPGLPEDTAKKPPPPKKQKKKARMSTGVHLLDPADPGGAAPTAAPGSRGAPSAELQPFHELIGAYMASQGHSEPTPIQSQCWPPCCLGRDVQGVAEPGSGKTLAYLLPGAVRMKVSSLLQAYQVVRGSNVRMLLCIRVLSRYVDDLDTLILVRNQKQACAQCP